VAAAVLLATRREDDGTAAAWDAVAVGGLGAVLALLWAAGRRRTASSRGDRLAALLPVYCAVPLAAAAGWVALPGPPGAVHALLAAVAAGAAAALGQVAVRVAAPAPIAALVITMSVMTAAVVNLWFVVPIPTVAALTGAVAVSAGPLLPRVALRLARLPRPVAPADAPGLVAADDGPDLLPHDELAERAALARSHLAGLSGGCALTAAVAAPLGAAMSGWAGPALAVVIVTVLILRARGFADPAVAGVQLASGTTAGLALVGVVAAANNGVNRLLCALVLLGAAATGTAALGRDGRGGSPVARRAVDISEGVLTAAAIPLALAAAGVFAVLRAR
jgi:type VII secretion integral membrane protein EccD